MLAQSGWWHIWPARPCLAGDHSPHKKTGPWGGRFLAIYRNTTWQASPNFSSRGGRLRTAVVFNVGLGRFAGVVRGIRVMTVSKVSMMCCSLVPASLMMFGGFAMMSSRMLVMFRCLVVVFRCSL